jgi:hypothetical protein
MIATKRSASESSEQQQQRIGLKYNNFFFVAFGTLLRRCTN